jgi:transcriptional regulator with XRE-family HTH domain
MGKPAASVNQANIALQSTRIGERLRAQRESLGISLRELARRIEVSPSLVSQIERDRVTPSVQTLYALATALGLTMGEVFADDERPGPGAAAVPVVSPGTRRVITLASGVQWERLTAMGDPLIEFNLITYDVGGASCEGDSLMTHAGKEFGYVLSGRLGVRIGFDEYELGPGESISFDSSSPHRLWAIGNEPAEAIWVVVGRGGDPRFDGS